MYRKFESLKELAKYINTVVDKILPTQYILDVLSALEIKHIYVVNVELTPSFYGKIVSGVSGPKYATNVVIFNCKNCLVTYNVNMFKIRFDNKIYSIYYYDVKNYQVIRDAYLTFAKGIHDTHSIISIINRDIVYDIFYYFNITI